MQNKPRLPRPKPRLPRPSFTKQVIAQFNLEENLRLADKTFYKHTTATNKHLITEKNFNKFADLIRDNSELENFKNFNIRITDDGFITLIEARKAEFIKLQQNNTHRFTIYTIGCSKTRTSLAARLEEKIQELADDTEIINFPRISIDIACNDAYMQHDLSKTLTYVNMYEKLKDIANLQLNRLDVASYHPERENAEYVKQLKQIFKSQAFNDTKMITIGHNDSPTIFNKDLLKIINDKDTNIKFTNDCNYDFQNNSNDKKEVVIYQIDAYNKNTLIQELQNFSQSDIKESINWISRNKLKNNYPEGHFFTDEDLKLKKEYFSVELSSVGAEKADIIKEKEIIDTKSKEFFSKKDLEDLVNKCLVEKQNTRMEYRANAQNQIVQNFRNQLYEATSIDDIKNITNNLLKDINNTINVTNKCCSIEQRPIFKNEEQITNLKKKLKNINKSIDDNKYEKNLMEKNNKPNLQVSSTILAKNDQNSASFKRYSISLNH